MIEIYAIVAGSLLIVGAIVGALTVLAVGIHREEKAYTFTGDSPSRMASGARAATGLYSKAPGVTQQPDFPRPDRLALTGPGPYI